MQSSFKRTIKKVAAIGTGVAMLGMTLTGALAADLTNYPSSFGTGSIVVVGTLGDESSDNLAASDIALGLPSTSTSGSTTKIEGGVSEDIPLGSNIAAINLIDTELDDGDLENLQDTTISFAGADYDISEVLTLSQKNNVSVVSSLGSAFVGSGIEDDYESNVYMEVGAQNAIRYFYKFDEAINVSKDVTTTNALKLKFLGKTLKLVSTDSSTPNTKFTAYVGNEYFMNTGDSVVVNGKTIKLENVGSTGSVAVSVDGVPEIITSGNTETVNGVEITNDEAFYTSAGKDQTSASLVIGKDSSSSIKDGDYFPGGDEVCSNNDSKDVDCWRWVVSGLNSGKSSTVTAPTNGSDISTEGTILGIRNYFIVNDDSDNPPGIGDCVALPNNFVSICLDSLTVADTDYMNLKISLDTSASFTDVYPEQSSVSAIKIQASESEGLKIKQGTGGNLLNLTKDTKTDVVWLNYGENGSISVFYENDVNQVRLAGNISIGSADIGEANGSSVNWLETNYKDTKNTNIDFDLSGNGSSSVNLTLDIVGDSAADLGNGYDDLNILLGTNGVSGPFKSIGLNANSEEAGELIWGVGIANNANNNPKNATIGSKDEDHRTMYGIIIKDPKSHGASDEVELEIPGDQVMAKVVVTGVAVQTTGGSTTSAAIKKDTEVTDVTMYNAILVGGPCANSLTAQVMGQATTWPECAEGFSAGNAILEIKDQASGKLALIAAGYSAEDTRRAGVVLKNFGSFSLSGASKTVSGTGLEVGGITVA